MVTACAAATETASSAYPSTNIGFKPKSGVISEREHQYLLSHNIREVFSGVGEGCQGLGGGVVVCV
jgi:hypothetical protein